MTPSPRRPEAMVRATWTAMSGASHDSLLEALLAHYGEASRRYHDPSHVAWVLQHCRQILEHLSSDERAALDIDAIELAVLCHDVVYDSTSSTNEADSAAFAVQCATAFGWSADRQQLAERLVLATAAHRPADLAEAVVVDADLAILGANADDYDAYTRAVRAEYGHVSDEQWRVGRAAVLEHLLATDTLFTTAYMRSQREQQARHNLRRELASLSTDEPGATS